MGKCHFYQKNSKIKLILYYLEIFYSPNILELIYFHTTKSKEKYF
jgi:hypothetical protein